jgi:hypothetical protein
VAAPTVSIRGVFKALAAILVVELVSTARHEGSHALIAWIEGAHIDEVRLLPGINAQLGFYFGLVRHHGGRVTWLVGAAPFLSAAAMLVAYYFWARKPRPLGVVRTGVILLCLVSPFVDLAWNYSKGFWRPTSDVARLLNDLPTLAVHGFFTCSLVLAVLLIMSLRQERQPVGGHLTSA